MRVFPFLLAALVAAPVAGAMPPDLEWSGDLPWSCPTDTPCVDEVPRGLHLPCPADDPACLLALLPACLAEDGRPGLRPVAGGPCRGQWPSCEELDVQCVREQAERALCTDFTSATRPRVGVAAPSGSCAWIDALGLLDGLGSG